MNNSLTDVEHRTYPRSNRGQQCAYQRGMNHLPSRLLNNWRNILRECHRARSENVGEGVNLRQISGPAGTYVTEFGDILDESNLDPKMAESARLCSGRTSAQPTTLT